jgi:cytochrome c556
MIIRTVLAVAAIAVGISAVSAQDVITERKAAMKRLGSEAGVAGRMLKGEMPYDQARAQQIFQVIAETAPKIPSLFPPGSDKGDTRALPAIWQQRAQFEAIATKLGAEAKQAQAAVKDLNTFKASFGAVARNCGACHETFRRPQQ